MPEQTKTDVFRGVAPRGGCEFCGRGQCCNCNWTGEEPSGSVKKRAALAGHWACESCFSAVMQR